MLSTEDNEILTRVGPGTPMGNLLRRYWIPACLSSEVDEADGPSARVRLLGEDLVAFRDTNGEVGLIEEQCPHRGASLFYGRNEEYGLRCTYHGWKFDVHGQCVDQRSELNSFAHKIRITSYPVHRLLLRAAKGLMKGEEPPAPAGSGDFRSIRGAEKVLAEGEDWRVLGTNDDHIVQGALLVMQGQAGAETSVGPRPT